MKVEDRLAGASGIAGKSSELYVTPDGSRLVLLPYGARVLGLFAPDSDENFYWTNPALTSSDSDELFRREGWHNSGGDRTWVAPEVDLHFPQSPDLSVYKVPGEVDPGRYEVQRPGKSMQFVTRADLRLFCSHQTVEAEIGKSWSAAANPLRYETVWGQMAGVGYAGYTQKTSLRLLDPRGSEAGPIGAWNLIQLPHGGTAFFPTHGAAAPAVYVGSILPENIEVKDRSVRYKMRSSGIQKIGIRAAVSTGRAAYMYPAERSWVLVIRNVFINPGAEYIDVPWTDTGEFGDRGYAFQACNVNHNEVGTFSELEYHAPAIGRSTGQLEYDDISQVWAFRGPERSIRTIGQILLSPDF